MKKKIEPAKVRVSLMITPEQEYWIKKISNKKKISQSSLIRESIDTLKNMKKYR